MKTLKRITIKPSWIPARSIITIREPGDVPRIGDTYARTALTDGRVLWQRQIHTGEFHAITDSHAIANLEALFSRHALAAAGVLS